MTELTIEPARRDELPAILLLYSQLNPDDPALEESKARSIWERLIEAEQTTVLVARAGGAVIGSCTITIVPNLTRGGRSYATIENVVTDARRRRSGIGRALLAAAVDRAWAENCYKVMLATGSKREETLRFYEKSGFAKGTKTFFEAKRL